MARNLSSMKPLALIESPCLTLDRRAQRKAAGHLRFGEVQQLLTYALALAIGCDKELFEDVFAARKKADDPSAQGRNVDRPAIRQLPRPSLAQIFERYLRGNMGRLPTAVPNRRDHVEVPFGIQAYSDLRHIRPLL